MSDAGFYFVIFAIGMGIVGVAALLIWACKK